MGRKDNDDWRPLAAGCLVPELQKALDLPGMEYREIRFPGAIDGYQDMLIMLKKAAQV